jgi:uncharacterized repeat protein (TIGR01451 family)
MNRILNRALGRGATLAVLALSALLGTVAANAAGTAAGTTIGNNATLTYSVGTVSQNPIGSSPGGNTTGTGSTTTFVVDNKVVHTVTTSDGSPVSAVPGQTAVTATFVVSNTGNNTQDYALTVTGLSSGAQTIFGSSYTDTFNVTSCSTFIGATGSTQLSYLLNLTAGSSQTVRVVCSVPLAQVNTDLSGIYLTAEAKVAGTNGATALTLPTGANDPNAVDVVLADAAGSDDATRDGKSSSRSAYRVTTATLNIAKTVSTVCDPLNGATTPMNIPGGFVQYTITITNNGSAPAILTQITDAPSTNVTFDSDLITGSGVAANCVAGVSPTSAAGKGFKVVSTVRPAVSYPKYLTTSSNGDGATYDSVGNLITIDFATALPIETGYVAGELKVGESVSVVYQVKIN